MNTERVAAQAPTTHTLAIVSLVLGILGLIGLLPLVGAIGAIVSGHIARQEIRAQPHAYTGEGMARTGIILGWVGIAVGALCLVAVIGILLYLVPVTAVSTGAPQPIVVTVQAVP